MQTYEGRPAGDGPASQESTSTTTGTDSATSARFDRRRVRDRRHAARVLDRELAPVTVDEPVSDRERAAWRLAWTHLRRLGLVAVVPEGVRCSGGRGDA
jgi:hypothetical protein